ncbi:MAG: DUF2946 domain-containing protein [Rhodanobacteraceae bacterium]
MSLRNRRLQRTCAWLGLAAIVLLSIVPTVSQLFAASVVSGTHVAIAGDAHASARHHCDGAMPGMAEHRDGAPCPHHPGDDPWHKCGYCDFLTHAPAIAGFEFVARFATAFPDIVATAADAHAVHAAFILAARPRGPPASV